MTVEEAVEQLKIMLRNAEVFDEETEAEAIMIAIKALDKQIPIQPKFRRVIDLIDYGRCPVCRECVNDITDQDICSKCGQVLKWGD